MTRRQEVLKQIAARKALKKRAFLWAKNEKTPSLLSCSMRRGALIHKDPAYPGGWRITWWDEWGFSGHTSLKTREEAIERALEDGYYTPDTQEKFKEISRTSPFIEGSAIALKSA